MAVKKSPLRPNKASLIVLCILGSSLSAYPISVSLFSGGTWTPDLGSAGYNCIPTTPGADFSPSSIESASNQVVLDVTGAPNNFLWAVSIIRADTTWYSGFTLNVKRSTTHTNISGGDAYDVVPTTTARQFFQSTVNKTETTGINCQYQLQGLTVLMGTSNSTTITYTVAKL